MDQNPIGPTSSRTDRTDASAEMVQLRRQLDEADLDRGEAWRRYEMSQFECDQWKKRLSSEREEKTAMEKSFSWWVTTPLRELARMQARLRRSIAKRMAKLRNKSVGTTSLTASALDERENAPAQDPAAERALKIQVERFRDKGFLGGPTLPSRQKSEGRQVPEIAVYFSAAGNYFFQEIAHLLHAGIKEAGFRSVLRSDAYGPSAESDFHLVVAPHEFFILGQGRSCFPKSVADRIVFLNTEQPQTKWFQLAKVMFPQVRHIFDMDRQTAEVIKASGCSASHLPLGYLETFAPYSTDADLVFGAETEALGANVRRWRDSGQALAQRPIDLSFVGEATPRRSAFFAELAPALADLECHLRLMPSGSGPWPARGMQIHRRTLTTAGLSQRSKIVLNIHRDQEHYFEWHRLVQMGIWQRALVLTETVSDTPPFIAGQDYVQATLAEMPRLIEYYLHDPRGTQEAERIRNSGFEKLKTMCSLPALLRQLWAPLLQVN